MPILAIMIPYIVWTMIMYAVIIMTYHSGDNRNVAMVKICKVYMDDNNVAIWWTSWGASINDLILG